jgi:hypothetical protein
VGLGLRDFDGVENQGLGLNGGTLTLLRFRLHSHVKTVSVPAGLRMVMTSGCGANRL